MDYLINMNKTFRLTILYLAIMAFMIPGILYSNLILIGLGFIALGILIYTSYKDSKKEQSDSKNAFMQTLKESKFNYDEFYIGHNYTSGVAIDTGNQIISTLHKANNVFSIKHIHFKDILESSIVEDDLAITKTSKSGAIGGAIVGNVLAGGVGAVIGGLSADKTSSDKVLSVKLSIVIDDLINPICNVEFLNSPIPIKKSSTMYNNIKTDINKWHKTISVILKRNELNTKTV